MWLTIFYHESNSLYLGKISIDPVYTIYFETSILYHSNDMLNKSWNDRLLPITDSWDRWSKYTI